MRQLEDGSTRYFTVARLAIPAAPLLGLATFLLLEWGDKSQLPQGTPELAVWQVLLAAQVVVWTALAGAGLRGLGRLHARLQTWSPDSSLTPGERRQRRKQTLWFVAPIYGAVGLMIVFGQVADIRNPALLPGQEWKILLLHLVGGAAAVPFFVALKWIQRSAAEDAGWSATADAIDHIRLLRRSLRTATASLGTIIALAVISTGANRHAVEAADRVPLPESIVFIYGAWFTGVLAAVYLYVFAALDGRARSIMEQAAPLPDPNPASAEDFAVSAKLRHELAQELELGGDPRKNLEGLIAVFSPLVGALLSRLGGLP